MNLKKMGLFLLLVLVVAVGVVFAEANMGTYVILGTEANPNKAEIGSFGPGPSQAKARNNAVRAANNTKDNIYIKNLTDKYVSVEVSYIRTYFDTNYNRTQMPGGKQEVLEPGQKLVLESGYSFSNLQIKRETAR